MISWLINIDTPPLRKTDTVSRALIWMDEFKVSHLPLIDDEGKLIGNVSETDLIDSNHIEKELGRLNIPFNRTFAYENQHYLDIVKLFSTNTLSVIPVINKEEALVGTISCLSLVRSLQNLSLFRESGAIISLIVHEKDYTMTQISNIIEGNDAKILGMYLLTHSENNELEVVIKINKYDIIGIIQTFERYNYKVSGTIDNKDYDNNLKNRFDEFMNYLNL